MHYSVNRPVLSDSVVKNLPGEEPPQVYEGLRQQDTQSSSGCVEMVPPALV